MSERWPGGLISKTPVTPSGFLPTSTAPGIWTIDQMNYWKAQGLWPNASADPYWSYVSYLMSTTATNTQTNNTFLDSSTNNFTITRNGNTTQGSVTPYGPLWSNYLNGSSYLTAPANAAYAFGTGDFTVECWINLPAASAGGRITTRQPGGGSNGTWGFNFSPTTFAFTEVIAGEPGVTASGLPNMINAWTHLVACRSGTTLRLFANGVQVGSGTNSTNFNNSSFALAIGAAYETVITGYISNVRIVKGTALYTAAFTPPTVPLTAVSGTSILTCQSNRFIDNSSNAAALTLVSAPVVSPFSPFVLAPPGYTTATNGGSGYFDGNGDYLSLAGASAFSIATSTTPFTVEAWIYPTAAGGVIFSEAYTGAGNTIPIAITMSTNTASMDPTGGQYVSFGYYNGSAFTVAAYATAQVSLNGWTHVACVFTGSTTKIFYNGADVTGSSPATTWGVTGTAGDGWYIGRRWDTYAGVYFSGYISNFRFVNGTAVYTAAFTPPTAPVTAITNTALLCNFTNGGIYDASMNGNAETVGSAQVSSTQAKYGTTSAKFNGTTDGLFCSGPTVALTNGSFTWECWVNFTALTGNPCLINVGVTDNDRTLLYFDATNGIRYVVARGGADQVSIQQGATTGWSTGTWYHVAVVRNGNNYAIYRDGTSVASGTSTYAQSILSSSFSFGYSSSSGTKLYLNGYLDDIRVTNGVARYTANFTPPTAALPVY